MTSYGLIGHHISYSFSRTYFKKKFQEEHISAQYENFDLAELNSLPTIIRSRPDLRGLNVTIPYKEEIIPYLDRLDPTASRIGAVNTIRIESNGLLTGYNTDYIGFLQALQPFLQPHHKRSLILGTGGASKAIVYALNSIGIPPVMVSRKSSEGILTYHDLDQDLMRQHQIIINCTPLGTAPEVSAYPPLPWKHLSPNHLVFDLVYNPPVTKLMQLAQEQGAQVSNGLEMLKKQAEAAWKIWNED